MTFGYNPFIDNFDFKGTSSGGTVTSVSGTTNRITSTGGATPVIDISASYVGQSSITTLGTVTTGTWNATAISAVKGGTGQTGYAIGDILYASSTTSLSKLPVGNNGQVLSLVAGSPAWADQGILAVSGSLTSAQVKTLHGSPVQVIAAPGLGKLIQLISFTSSLQYGGTNAFTAPNGQTINLYPGLSFSAAMMLSNASLVGTVSTVNSFSPSVTAQQFSSLSNVPIFIYSANVNEISGNAAGDNSIAYNIVYRIITFP